MQGTSHPNPELLDAIAMCGHLVARCDKASHDCAHPPTHPDNAWSYRHGWQLRQFLEQHAITHKFIRRACPMAPPLQLLHYNTQRRHTALGGDPPISRLQSPT
jgi:hypothetical protein